jgi:hypothetical protein
MTPSELNSYITSWESAYISRVFIALIGIAIITMMIGAIMKKNFSLLAIFLALFTSSVCLFFAIIPQETIRFVISTPYMTRIRIIMGSISFLVLLITLESVRRNNLQERYAILWVATALVIVFCAVFPAAVALLRAITGMSYVAVIVAVAFTFLILVAFHFSISLSRLTRKITQIAQELAILKTHMEDRKRDQESEVNVE